MSRRAALQAAVVVGGVGAAAVAAVRTGLVPPHAEPNPADVRLLAEAARSQAALITELDGIVRRHGVDELSELRSVLVEQQAAVTDEPVGGTQVEPSADRDDALTDFANHLTSAAGDRADAALAAGSLALLQVLAGMSAGLDQAAWVVRDLA